jgi:hypothetical protein
MNMRWLINRAISMAVSKGINTAARGGKDRSEMTQDDRKAAQSKRQNMGRVRQAANMLRRFMR